VRSAPTPAGGKRASKSAVFRKQVLNLLVPGPVSRMSEASAGIGMEGMRRQTRASLLPGILAVAGAGLVAACASVPGRSPAQARADAVTADRVYLALNSDPVYFFRHVDVSVDDGVARLSGVVWTTEALFAAQRIARDVPGVTRVVNRMELERAALRGGGDGGGP
jgi:hypothetical protein